MAKDKNKKEDKKEEKKGERHGLPMFPPKLIGALADEVAKTVAQRLPSLISRPKKKSKSQSASWRTKVEEGFFLDTSAIIDGRIFSVIEMGLLVGACVVIESILLELKHIADSQDAVRRERGRKGLEFLEKLKKSKTVKFMIMQDKDEDRNKHSQDEVDEELIKTAKKMKGRIITCDYNLSKKANIQGVLAVNINTLANLLKVTAVPGESLHVKILHKGKDETQGVGYLDDGTMIVVENGSGYIDETVDVVVSRVIQTSAGRILFSKRI